MRDGGLVPSTEERWLTAPARLVVRRRARLLRDQASGAVLDLRDADTHDALVRRLDAGERYDTVVSVLCLCAMADLLETATVLRGLVEPGGRLLFLEPSTGSGATARVQRLLAPAASAVSRRRPRDVPAVLRQAGFRVTDCERSDLPMPWPWRTFVEGSAR